MWKIISFIFIVASLLVGIWFKDGYILGAAEDGLIFYNISNYFHQAEYTWMEYPGLGSPSLTLIAGKPTYFILSFLQDAGIPGFLIQGIVLWFILVSSGAGVYLLIRELFPNLPDRYLLLGILFYWFNPISLADVWNRFLLNYIFFFALLPVGSYFYIKGLRQKKFFWILVLNTLLLFYSYAFSYMAFTILYWIHISLITLTYAILGANRLFWIFSLKYFLVNLIIFSLFNSWWVLPLIFLNISGGTTPNANLFLNQNNSGLLDALSKSTGKLTGIFSLTNASFADGDSLDWVRIYSFPLLFLMYIMVGLIIYFLIKLRSNLTVLFLGTLFAVAVFLSKGNNPPFGEIYNFIYKKILFLQVFRNPFEKFGYLLSLISALLVAPSIYEVSKRFRNNLSTVFYIFFLIIIFYLSFPFFSGLVFTNRFPPTNNLLIGYKVQVPDYYKEANDWLISQGANFRYIGLPIKDEGITYNWEKGYAGVELNVALFSNSGIIHNTSVPFFNQVVPQIEKSLFSDGNFSNLSNLLNARYYILRYDVDYKLRGMTDPRVIEKTLKGKEQNSEMRYIATFGKVDIWENLKWQDHTFYIARKILSVKNYDDYYDLSKIDTSQGEILLDSDGLVKAGKIVDDQEIGSQPDIIYEKINSTKYNVHIKNASKPFLVFFSNIYNDGWQAVYSDNEMVKNHIRVNVFGNGWIVERAGTYNLTIEFAPQKYMGIGEKVSFAGLILIVGGLLVLRFKKSI